MATTIKLKNGSGAPLAGDLVQGEPALDLTNKRLYTEDSGGTVIEVGTNPTSLTTGTFTSTGIDDNATSTAITIDSSQRIGVGTASPAYKLDIYGDSSSNVDVLHLLNENVTSGNSVGVMFENYSGGGLNQGRIKYLNSGSNNSNSFVFEQEINGVNGLQETMRISNAGNVGIGTASPDGKLNVFSASAGSVSADADADELVLENSGNVGLSLLTASTGESGIYFGNPGTNGQKDFYLKYYHESHATTANRRAFTFNTGSTERMRIDSSGNVGIGTASPDGKLNVVKGTASGTTASTSANNIVIDGTSGTETGMTLFSTVASGIRFGDASGASQGVIEYGHATDYMRFVTNAAERMRIDSSGNVGIGTSSPSFILGTGLHIDSTGYTSIVLQKGGAGQGHNIDFTDENNTLQYRIGTNFASGGENLLFAYGSTPTIGMTLNSSGNVGIGTTSPSSDSIVKFLHINDATSSGLVLQGAKKFSVYSSSSSSLIFRDETAGTNRITLDSSGNLLVGKTAPNSATAGVQILPEGDVGITRNGSHSLLLNRLTSDGDIALFRKDGTTVGSIGNLTSSSMYINGNGSAVANLGFGGTSLIYPTVDNVADLGIATFRFDDIYATNDVIQTSDANEKQDIEALSEAETRVAVAAKALLRKFRWKSAVEEKGDEARIHFGIVAQDLKAAFEAEGLDAGRYAMFIHSTWTDEETGEERSRMGVRYSELLAFIIAAI
jgi:hypothetical protein